MDARNLEKTDIKDWYIENFSHFEQSLNGGTELPFHDVRKQALAKFAQLGFPTTRQEEWKYTNISPLLKHHFDLATEPSRLAPEAIQPFLIPGLEGDLIVTVDGQFSPELSFIHSKQKGLIITSLSKALSENNGIVAQHLAKYAPHERETFAALNTAFAKDGAFIYIPDNVSLEKPIHLLNVSSAGKKAVYSSPRNLIVVGKNSELHLVESHHNLAESIYFTNTVSELVLSQNADVEHVKLQDESKAAFHIATAQVYQSEASRYTVVSVDLGGALVRNNLSVQFGGEHATSNLLGFYFVNGKQLIDSHTMIDHAVPNCESNELYKGILDDKAKGVFNGKVYVHPDAQKTNAFQQNQALLLSDMAMINSKPQLEIFADDVKCSHGATVGELDPEMLFYLRSRGIDEKLANYILRIAFARDIISRIKIKAVRDRLENIIIERFQK